MFPFSFVIDYETTGFDAIRNDGITLGVVVLDHQLNQIDEGYFEFKPDLISGMNEENVATDIHKITLKEMLFFQDRREGLIQLMKFLAPYKCALNNPRPLFFHSDNRKFDYQFLEWAFRKEDLQYSLWKIFDAKNSFGTVALCRELGYEGNRLDAWGVRLGETFNHHNAMADAKICHKIIKYILENNFQGNVEKFFEHLNKEKDNDIKKDKVQEVQSSTGEWSFLNL